VAGIGLDAEVSRRANSLPRWLRGHGGYALALAPTLLRFAPLPMKISTREESGTCKVRSDQPTILVAFANTSTYGGGMRIAPRARVDDGLLDICVIAGIDPFKLACLFPTVYFGRHLRVSGVEYYQATSVRVDTEFPLDVYADGEYVTQTPVELRIEARCLKVLTPGPQC
jgi:diacylglycerol kinase family enzyme